MAVHIAILKPWLIDSILAGEKTTESRLTKTAQPPYDRIRAGERLFLKDSGGPFRATAVAGWVEQHHSCTPGLIERLRRTHEPSVRGGDDYWRARSDRRYAVLIKLSHVEPMAVGPPYRVAHMRAWYVLEDQVSPVFESTLTAGAIRNRYVVLPRAADGLDGESFTLELPDGERVGTSLVKNRMVRWRGWGAYFERYAVTPGDRLRFVVKAPGVYRVSFLP